jgi:hypothetical protein
MCSAVSARLAQRAVPPSGGYLLGWVGRRLCSKAEHAPRFEAPSLSWLRFLSSANASLSVGL